MKVNYKLKFLSIIITELCFLPLLFFIEALKKAVSSEKPLRIKRRRETVENDNIYINIHEWGGYDMTRKKEINKIAPFECGLLHQLERFRLNKCRYEKKVNITISDFEKFKFAKEVLEYGYHIDQVSNIGMDFSGYHFFYNKIKKEPNAYVILTNTSVNKEQTLFLDDYLNYMENNPDVGIMGISYCAKKMQTLVRNNFTPHLQSFFLLTTSKVLDQIVEANNGKFPGAGIDHKLMLIREGEIRISELAQKIGYNIAVTLEDGSVYKFGMNSVFDNGYKRWKLKNTDIRLFLKKPNLINEITQ